MRRVVPLGGSWSGSKGTSGSQSTGALSANANYHADVYRRGRLGTTDRGRHSARRADADVRGIANQRAVGRRVAADVDGDECDELHCFRRMVRYQIDLRVRKARGALTPNEDLHADMHRQRRLVAKTASVTVLPAPTLTFTASPTSVQSGAATQLTWTHDECDELYGFGRMER